ncbi:MAG TPA: MBL fold metallo-hydrolase [Blastocatellia bacterium]|nr:MBL fold metallo-hydrolase [Blastocatellia bacterium]
MKSLLPFSLLLTICLLASPAFAQQDFSKVEIKVHKVAGNVYMLEGAGGNIGVSVGNDGVLIIDDQYAPLSDKIRAALKSINPGPLKFVINTHFHGDHTGGNPNFGKEAPIIAHDNVRRRLTGELQPDTGSAQPMAKEGLPVISYAQSVSVHFNGEELKVIHFPRGHTDGDSVIFFAGSNVVHMGDDFFAGKFPFVDLSSGGSVQGLEKNIAEVIKRLPADVKIIPGHGPISSLDDLKAYHAMLVETIDVVRKQMAAGKSLDDIRKGGLPDKFKDWGTGFIKPDRWIETIHKSLSAK